MVEVLSCDTVALQLFLITRMEIITRMKYKRGGEFYHTLSPFQFIRKRVGTRLPVYGYKSRSEFNLLTWQKLNICVSVPHVASLIVSLWLG